MDEKTTSINLMGDRDVEWSWIAARLPSGPGDALDFGAGCGLPALMAAQRGFNVTAVDLQPQDWPFAHPRLRFLQGDILDLPLPESAFDLVINCSTVEHVGLAGRYGIAESLPDGDLAAMARLRALMRPTGTMLLTIPLGRDAVFAPRCRIYGAKRLPLLLAGYSAVEELYWCKDERNRWTISGRGTALDFVAVADSLDPLENRCALGCFRLMVDGGGRTG